MQILADLDDLLIAKATRDHLGVIERLLADDPTSPSHVATTTLVGDELLGDAPPGADLAAAFERIDADPNQLLAVVLDDTERVIGTFQLSLIPTLARGGGVRAMVNGARIRAGKDSVLIAKRVFGWIVQYSRKEGARVLLVVTDKARAHLYGFYTTMGFRSSHDGLTLPL